MQTFFKRLLHVVENQGFKNLNDFALNGLKYDSSSKLSRLKDESKSPSVEILLDISNKFGEINLHWLLTGIGEISLPGSPNAQNVVNEPILGYQISPEALLKERESRINDLLQTVADLRKDKELLTSIIEGRLKAS